MPIPNLPLFGDDDTYEPSATLADPRAQRSLAAALLNRIQDERIWRDAGVLGAPFRIFKKPDPGYADDTDAQLAKKRKDAQAMRDVGRNRSKGLTSSGKPVTWQSAPDGYGSDREPTPATNPPREYPQPKPISLAERMAGSEPANAPIPKRMTPQDRLIRAAARNDPGIEGLMGRLDEVGEKFADPFVGPQQTPEEKAKAQQESQFQREAALDEKQADTANAAKLRSYAPSMNSAESTRRSELLGLPDDPAERRKEMTKGMEADFLRRNQAPTNSNLWAAMAGTAKGNLIRQAGAARMGQGGPSQEQKDKEEFEGRKVRMAESRGDPTTEGGRMTARNLRQVSDEDKLARDSSPEGKAYLAKVSKQAGLSKPAESLDEFKEQQRLNRQQIVQRGNQTSARNRAAMTAGQIGKELSSDETDPNVVRAHQVGMRKGPSLAQAMVFNRDESAKKRSEAERDGKLRLLAQLTAANQQAPSPKLKAAIEALADELAGLPVEKGLALPKSGDKYSPDELAGMVPKSGGGPAKLKPKVSASVSPKKSEQKPGLWSTLFGAMNRDPYEGMTKEEKDAAIKKAQEASPYRGRYGGY